MMRDRNYYKGDIFFADLGEEYKGNIQGGRRPVMIIQNDIGNKYSPTVIVAAITSQMGKSAKLPTHVNLDYKYIGLERESFVMLEQITTINKTQLIAYVGCVNKTDIVKINKAAVTSLALQEITNEIINRINNLVKEISSIDYVLMRASYCDVQNQQFLNTFKVDKDHKLQDLKNICDKNGLDINDYYKNKRGQRLIKVG